jgi:hypothetical protein
LFNSYIASSVGFPAYEEYFVELRNESFAQLNNYNGQRFFIKDRRFDPLDPDGVIHKQLIDFSNSVNEKLAERIY